MKRFVISFLFLFVFNFCFAEQVQEQAKVEQTKGKLTTSFILAAVSDTLQEVAKASTAQTDKEKMECVLNITATALAVAAQATSKGDKDKKGIVLDDIEVEIENLQVNREDKELIKKIIVILSKNLFL